MIKSTMNTVVSFFANSWIGRISVVSSIVLFSSIGSSQAQIDVCNTNWDGEPAPCNELPTPPSGGGSAPVVVVTPPPVYTPPPSDTCVPGTAVEDPNAGPGESGEPILCGDPLVWTTTLPPLPAAADISVPALRFGDRTSLRSTTAAETFYGTATTHTNGLGAGRSAEIVSLAAGLDHDPALIFQYVHDNVEYYPTFGLGKGALGAHLDKSGTALDQAHLLAELLDIASVHNSAISNVRIVYGKLDISNNDDEITAWLGDYSSGELCLLLANGGIPAQVNNSTGCHSNDVPHAAPATDILIGHAWVTADIDGSNVLLDPGYKQYEEILPLSVNGQNYISAMSANCSNGYALTAGAPLSSSATEKYAKSFQYDPLAGFLKTCATQLWDWIEANAPGASVEDIVGGRRIIPGAEGVTARTSGYTAHQSWSVDAGVPDQYRFKMTVQIDRSDVYVDEEDRPLIDSEFDLFMDEVYGKRVSLEPNGFTAQSSNLGPLPSVGMEAACVDNDFLYELHLKIGTDIQPNVGLKGPCAPHSRGAYMTVKMDAPYEADSGTYHDTEFFNTNHTLVTRSVFALSAGDSSADWARYYQQYLGLDRLSHFSTQNGVACCGPEPELLPVVESKARLSENVRYRIFAAWAEQFSRLNKLSSSVAGAPLQHHFTFGWVYGLTRVNKQCEGEAPAEACFWTIGDDSAVMTLETAMSAARLPTAAAPLKRMVANTSAALESSVMEQQLNSTAPGGTAQKFRWGNDDLRQVVPNGLQLDTPHGVDAQEDFKIYHFSSASELYTPASDDLSILTSSGIADCLDIDGPGPISDIYIQDCQEGALAGSINSYLAKGFKVIAVGDAYLGPGLRCGRFFFNSPTGGGARNDFDQADLALGLPSGGQWNCDSNPARGGAFIAYKDDFSEIAHISLTGGRASKGGAAGGGTPEELQILDVPTPADLLKEEEEASFVHTADLRSGRLSYNTGALITAGTGGFPYSLPFTRLFQSGEMGLTEELWDHNWNMPLTVSGSGNEMLGSSRGLFASETLATLSVLYGVYSDTGVAPLDRIKQETIGVLASAWWTDGLTHNVVSATVNGQAQQFVRKLRSKDFLPSNGGGARVKEGTKDRELDFPHSSTIINPDGKKRLTTLSWNTDGMSYELINPGQDKILYEQWRPFYRETWEGISYANGISQADKPGFRATKWTFPNNFEIDFTYTYSTNNDCAGGSGACEKPKLFKVQNSLGRFLQFTGPMDNPVTVKDDADRTISTRDDYVTHPDGKRTDYSVGGIRGFIKRINGIQEPGFGSDNHKFGYDSAYRLRHYENAHGNQWTYFVGGGRRGATRDPLGHDAVEIYDRDGNTIRTINKVGYVTESAYNGLGRITRRTMPEGDSMQVTYDENANVIKVKQCPKLDADCTDANGLVTTATYNLLFNKPTSVTDPMGNMTDLNYHLSGGGIYKVETVEQPADIDGNRPVWTYGYNADGRLTSATNPENEVTTASYDGDGDFTGVTIDPGGLDIITTIATHNDWGDPLTLNGPREDVTDEFSFTYDDARRPLTMIDALGSISKTLYNPRGWPLRQCVQKGDGAQTVECEDSNSANQSFWAVTYTSYTDTGQPSLVRDPDDNISYYYYDINDRQIVSVDAENRKTMTVYDPAGRVVKAIRAWAGDEFGVGELDCAAMRTATLADPVNNLQQCYQEYSYTDNGQVSTVSDANGNKTTYVYDGFDRQHRIYFPDAGAGGISNPSDFEEYTYDDNGNMVAKRTRDGDLIEFFYDGLNRLLDRHIPGAPTHTANGRTVSHDFIYDKAGRRLSATHDGMTLSYIYDDAGRMTSQSHAGALPVTYDYDNGGNQIRLTYPDGWSVDFTFDALNRVTAANDNNGTSRELANLTYDRLSRRATLSYANGTSSTYDYTSRGDLTDHDWSFSGASSISYDFTYNGVGQTLSETVSDTVYQFVPSAIARDIYAVNGLNQYTAINGVTVQHDGGSAVGNGNLTLDHRGHGYTYDAENVLRSATGLVSGTASYRYWADGTRREKSYNSVASTFYYTGNQEIAEYDGATLSRRYLRLPRSVDEPFLMIDYTVNASGEEHWAHQNRLGSVVAVTDNTGAVVEQHTYSPYGESGDTDTGFPFRFTGQKLDPETGLYYYKARYYDPETGRFLQTDPIGYGDGMNMYAYVGNDPVNLFDPSGLCGTREENYQDCTINVEDRDSLTDEQRTSVETIENKIKETGAAIAENGTDEEIAAWEDITEFNINSNRESETSPGAAATADGATVDSDGNRTNPNGGVNIWKPGVDGVTSFRNSGGSSLSSSVAGHIVIHEVYHFTATDMARRAALGSPTILNRLQYRNSEIRNDRASVAAGKRLGTLPSNYNLQSYRIGGF